jgi:mono/diheme cytochrome c family protein
MTGPDTMSQATDRMNCPWRERARRIAAALCAGSVVVLLSAGTASLAQPPDRSTTGDAQRGGRLFTDTYNCYACHGFDAQTGQRRLKPMNYTQERFISFVRNSPLPQMPAFADVPARDLADIYAYILSIPVDAPEVSETPLLENILQRKLGAFDADR